MKIKAVLFDLDGTLLPLDQDGFVKEYLKGLVSWMVGLGYGKEIAAAAITSGTAAALKNDGARSNEEAFFEAFSRVIDNGVTADGKMFEGFYVSEFEKVREAVCGFQPRFKDLIALIKSKGLRVAVATNPVFPKVATEARIRWAGLDASEFELYTTYEDSHYCKPTAEYYNEVLARMSLSPEDCLMVGNDVDDDMPAGKLGMRTFLLTDCLLNRQNKDISVYEQGGIEALFELINNL